MEALNLSPITTTPVSYTPLDVYKRQILLYFANQQNRDIIERLRVAGVRLEADDEDTSGHTDKLAGKSIVISGVFAHHSRDEYKELIEKHGGKDLYKRQHYGFARGHPA